MARAPLARPTDAPPAAHEPARDTDLTTTGSPTGAAPLLPERRAPAPCRDHHGRQPTLGAAARPVGARRARRRGRGDPGAASPRGPARGPGHDPVRVQPRELGPFRRRSHRPVRPARGGGPQRDRRAAGAGRPHPAAGPARRAAQRRPGHRSRRRSVRLRAASGCCSTSPSTTPAGPSSSTRSAGSPRAAFRPTRSTRRRSAPRCTRPACPIRTW